MSKNIFLPKSVFLKGGDLHVGSHWMGWMEEWKDEWTHGWMDRWMDEKGRYMNQWINGRVR